LKDLFKEGADYITPISENIKVQMQEQMDKDENVYYWLNDEIVDWNFKSITDETSFYLNEKDNVVIGFNEGEVAPMYMGTVEFEIPADVLNDIRK
ncbi:MAG: RsiV family protein, partial [Lachnospiraceae bacterium]|nr:RsiV family protein [Lachnospiraceae bacterium]